jgi:hypothetical protein
VPNKLVTKNISSCKRRNTICAAVQKKCICTESMLLYFVAFRISDPLIELSINVLLVQICIPYAMEHFQPRATIKSLLRHWFTAVGWALGLTDFLLPRPDENNNNGVQDNWNNNHRAGRRDIGVMVNLDARDHDIDDLALNNEIDEESDIDEQADNEYVSYYLLFNTYNNNYCCYELLIISGTVLLVLPS